MYRIKRFDLATVALYSFVMTFIVCLIVMIPVALLISAMGDMAQQSMPGYDDSFFPVANLGILFFLLVAVAYSVFATIIYTIIALLYNLISVKLGGIKIAVEKIDEQAVTTQHVEGLEEKG